MFGLKHCIIMIIVAAIIVVGSIFSRKLKFNTVCKGLFFIGIISEIVKIFYYIMANEEKYGGVLPKTDLPFHLCSIQIIFITIVVFASNEKLKNFILSFMIPSCLFGGIAAILIPTSSSLSSPVITVQYFLYHAALVVFAIRILLNKERKLEINDYFNCLKFLLILFFVAIYVNSILFNGVDNINFMYVASPPQSGLPFLNENNGWFVYIIHYAILILFCVSICYIKPIIRAIKNKRKSAEKGEN